RREIEQGFAQTFDERDADRQKLQRAVHDKSASEKEKTAALGSLLGLHVAEMFGRFNHESVLAALKDDCKKREERINDPCIMVHYDARSDKCVVRGRTTVSCLAK